jgi:hypothetical protein
MKQLTLEHLAPYLPYKLRILDGWGDIREMKYTHLDDDGNSGNIFGIKPILRPLSDLTKKIEDNRNKFVPINYINQHYLKCTIDKDGIVNDGIDKYEILFLPYCLIKELLQLHFDVFGLIEKGLAIDINTLES